MSCFRVPAIDSGGGHEMCANCGKEESDTIKLKNCTACFLVKYCGDDCQRAHRKQHKKACNNRAAELKDEQLYGQGLERPERDFCPICTLPIPLPMDEHSYFNVCCMKMICEGCAYAAEKRCMDDCPFCRTPYPDSDAAMLSMVQARALKKDPEAINFLGEKYCHGRLGLQKDTRKAVEMLTEAAGLGSIDALFNLGAAHEDGVGVQQDEAKAVEFYAKAAMQGHVLSRYSLGFTLGKKEGNYGRAVRLSVVRHFMISAKMGHKDSVEAIKTMFSTGFATKEQYVDALKGYQESVEETKSHYRDEAKAYFDSRK